MAHPARSWDVFCRVVDNYGDAAVCWRLARQLAADHGGRVRLWVDNLAVLHALHPGADPERDRQRVEDVEVLRWPAPRFDPAAAGEPAEIAIEGFGCGLPDAYVEAMARRRPAPLWITLEYLSAEPWVAAHHGLPSPHPRLALERYFFFPGFTPATGGLLKEAGLEARREAFVADAAGRQDFWRGLGYGLPARDALAVSLFGYDNPALAGLLDAWSSGDCDVVAAVPPGRLRAQATAHFGLAAADDGQTLRRGRLEVRLVPFMAQSDYDRLLWGCDWNFVRGEDSFVRAQWAARPLVWHIYPQVQNAHWVKLDAFLELWCAGLDAAAAAAARALWHAWNGAGGPEGDAGRVWQGLARHRDELARHALRWAKNLDSAGNLAEKLVRFCEDRLEPRAS